jgi:hypothetical protein
MTVHYIVKTRRLRRGLCLLSSFCTRLKGSRTVELQMSYDVRV